MQPHSTLHAEASKTSAPVCTPNKENYPNLLRTCQPKTRGWGQTTDKCFTTSSLLFTLSVMTGAGKQYWVSSHLASVSGDQIQTPASVTQKPHYVSSQDSGHPREFVISSWRTKKHIKTPWAIQNNPTEQSKCHEATHDQLPRSWCNPQVKSAFRRQERAFSLIVRKPWKDSFAWRKILKAVTSWLVVFL